MSKPKALAALAALIGVSVVVGAVALGAQTFSPPKTPWGHPDLQGIYSNDDETGTPMERPAQFEGKTLADITPEELQKIIKQRNEQFVDGVSGTEFAGGLRPPAHLIFDTFDRKNSRAWLVVDPPDGRIPRRTDAAPRRRIGGVSTNANPRGPFNSWLDMGLYDRCITRGIPNSMMPAGYGSRYDITQSPDSVVIRYEMIHEARVIPLEDGERVERRTCEGFALISRRCARLVGRQHPGRRDDQLPARDGAARRHRTRRHDRAIHRRLTERRRVACDLRGPEHLDAAVDVRDAADQGGLLATSLRVRVSRRQSRDAQHPQRGARRREIGES